jgi:uncharacterized membrane-anchored protein YitT (DUF2179 family)
MQATLYNSSRFKFHVLLFYLKSSFDNLDSFLARIMRKKLISETASFLLLVEDFCILVCVIVAFGLNNLLAISNVKNKTQTWDYCMVTDLAKQIVSNAHSFCVTIGTIEQ